MSEISMRVLADGFRADSRAIDKQADLETKAGLREVGRQLVRAEKTTAPVYKGRKGVTRKQFKTGPLVVNRNAPIVGLLRASVKQGRVRKTAEGYGLVVGPGGGRVNLYKGKIERKFHFVEQAYDRVVPEAEAIMAAGWERALRRGR